jgi:uncharacterized protein with HEPN domain
MPRDYKVFLEDILEDIGKIRRYTGGLSLQGFRVAANAARTELVNPK